MQFLTPFRSTTLLCNFTVQLYFERVHYIKCVIVEHPRVSIAVKEGVPCLNGKGTKCRERGRSEKNLKSSLTVRHTLHAAEIQCFDILIEHQILLPFIYFGPGVRICTFKQSKHTIWVVL